ncbi:MAG: thioredoxin fold domain-containing protein [Rubricoccaceae bacterium]|nr:thioredoxin fold domain-containing protein [Rubricoccaceae bacterium]
MIRVLSISAFVLFLCGHPAYGQQSQLGEEHDHNSDQPSAADYPDDSPNWISMEEAVAAAKADGDIVLIHAYAPWCGWCRELDSVTYTNDAVQNYLADHYEVTRLDVENDTQIEFFGGWVTMRELGMAFDVTSTPTTIFMDADGNYITKAPSFFPPDQFLLVLRYVKEQAYDMMSFGDYVEMIRASEG